MMFFGGDPSEVPFVMFDIQHLIIIGIFIGGLVFIYFSRKHNVSRKVEIGAGLSLVMFEVAHHFWLLFHGRWEIDYALPLHLSSISVILIIILLFTRSRWLFEIAFLVGIGGAVQAVMTPVLVYGWPHFRFIHFFYTHVGVIWVVFYFLWHKKFPLRAWSIVKAMVFLNVLLPLIWLVNLRTGGNYWFIMEKPSGASLLDVLGPHPWYILGMEAAALVLFTLLWAVFGRKRT
jgi:hypothetical integral membrane protein (TIGR02206 family)